MRQSAPSAVYSLEYIYYSLFIDKLHHNYAADASNKDSFRSTFVHEGGVQSLFFLLWTGTHTDTDTHVCISECCILLRKTHRNPCLQNYLSPLCPCVTPFPVRDRWCHSHPPFSLLGHPLKRFVVFFMETFNSNIPQSWPLALQGHSGWMRADRQWEKLKSLW